MSEVREEVIVNKITAYLKTVPGLWFMKVKGGPSQSKGIPDLIGSYLGQFFYFEVKRPGKEPSEIQQVVMKRLDDAGAIGMVVTDVDTVREFIVQYNP